MMLAFTIAFMYVEHHRRVMEVFPPNVMKVWNEWELRALILLSLACQIILIWLGNRRKYMPKTRIRVTIWFAYLMAEWVATVSLGVISRNVQDDINRHHRCDDFPNSLGLGLGLGCHRGGGVTYDNAVESISSELVAFWAPFLLLHLGGPDTITAYALEDNELWLRHLVGQVIQVGVAVYILLLSLPGTTGLPFLSTLVLVPGLIKCGERIWALRSANTEHFRDSMLTSPEPGPNYAKFMEDFTLKKAEGFHVKADLVIELPVPTHDQPHSVAKDRSVPEAYDLFQTFKRLFVDLILSFQETDRSRKFFKNLSSEEAFHVIEVELGFAFDELYTKAPVAYTFLGFMLRLVSLTLTLLLLPTFALLSQKNLYHKSDLIITYLLLVVALVLDIYALFLLLRSDWTHHWLIYHKRIRKLLNFPCLQDQHPMKKKRWSNSMAQYNLLSVCFREKPAVCYRLQTLLKIDGFREKHRYKTYNKVSLGLKNLIYDRFKNFTAGDSNTLRASENKWNSCLGANTIEFDQSILIWHIATDLCYYLDEDKNLDVDATSEGKQILSKRISDYMLYLLVMCPSMLPIGIGMIRFRDTCAEAREFFQGRGDMKKAKACKKLLQVNTEVPPSNVKGDRSKSVLFDACRLAKLLRKENERKWEVVSHVWVDMVAYAATHCRGHYHAQCLRKGGELITHVWLLMAHLGITEQFQISQGHARAKLVVK